MVIILVHVRDTSCTLMFMYEIDLLVVMVIIPGSWFMYEIDLL